MYPEHNKLMIIINDFLNNIVKKGEILENYYNPKDFFKEVHIVMIHDDYVEIEGDEYKAVQKMVGGAKLYLYNLPKPNFFSSLGWNKIFMKKWYRQGICLAEKIQPDVIRTYNNYLDGYLAYQIKKNTNIPYVVSLHGVWDSDCLISYKEKIFKFFMEKFERKTLKHADKIIAVYKPAYKYAQKYGGKNICLLYNKVAVNKIKKKVKYTIGRELNLITINRQIRDKNPENIIKAIKDLDCHYTLVGDGEYHEKLIELVKNLNCENKVTFIKSIPNEILCGELCKYDVLVIHCDYLGITKGTIEAAFAGIPIIVNRHKSGEMEDFEGEWAVICDNTVEGYRAVIQNLISSETERIKYGNAALDHANRFFNAERIEKETVEIYRKVIKGER